MSGDQNEEKNRNIKNENNSFEKVETVKTCGETHKRIKIPFRKKVRAQ